jgi:hypothetical protein
VRRYLLAQVGLAVLASTAVPAFAPGAASSSTPTAKSHANTLDQLVVQTLKSMGYFLARMISCVIVTPP